MLKKQAYFNSGFIYCLAWTLFIPVGTELDAETSVFEDEAEHICSIFFALAVLMLTLVSRTLKSLTSLDM